MRRGTPRGCRGWRGLSRGKMKRDSGGPEPAVVPRRLCPVSLGGTGCGAIRGTRIAKSTAPPGKGEDGARPSGSSMTSFPGFPNPGARWHLQAPASQEASFPRSADRFLLSWGGGDGGGAPRRADGSCRPLGSRGGVRPGARGQSSVGPSARPLPGKVCGRTRRKGETCRTARRGRAGTCRLTRERPQRI